MKTVTLLGTGLQGKSVLYDLTHSDLVSNVRAADKNLEDLKQYVETLQSDKIECLQLDAKDERGISKLLKGADIVIEVLPAPFCLPVAKLAAQNGVHLVNTMYLVDAGETDLTKKKLNEKEVRDLDKTAKDREVTILPELGMDPGIDLVLCGQAVSELDEVQELYSYGAGFPELEAADNPLKYKVTWTFEGVLKSYLRPAKVLNNGHVVDVAADEIFSQEHIHELDLEGIGRLEAFPNGDAIKYAEILGIQSSVKTMGRYVLRWPGHCEFWGKMAKLHFLDPGPIQVGENKVVPRDFLCSLLEPQLQYRDDERDLAVLRIDARGIKDGVRKRVVFQIIDRRNLETGFTAMTRTVGYAASIGAQMILRGDIQKKGVLSPVRDVPFEVFSQELSKRGIHVRRTTSSW